jgi:hypothetical protein
MFLAVVIAVLFLVALGYATWLYRQGSFPKSRLKKNAKRAARRAWELNREDRKHRPDSEQNPNERTD